MSPSPDEGRNDKSRGAKPAHQPKLTRKLAAESAGRLEALLAASAADWAQRTPEDRRLYVGFIEQFYVNILDEFFDEANACVGVVTSSLQSNTRWRLSLIALTGGLAILNLVTAFVAAHQSGTAGWVASFTLLAALYAAGLAIVTNLESFFNYAGRAQAYRESRELFLDAYREFEMLWHVRVRPFGDRPEACANASELYRLLVERDRELRGKLKDLTVTEKPDSKKTDSTKPVI
jgi:hypothetical protein